MPASTSSTAAASLTASTLPPTLCCAASFIESIAAYIPRRRRRRSWQARRESNPQPAVLETAALPIELLACDLFQDLGHHAGAHGASTLADRKAQPLLH